MKIGEVIALRDYIQHRPIRDEIENVDGVDGVDGFDWMYRSYSKTEGTIDIVLCLHY